LDGGVAGIVWHDLRLILRPGSKVAISATRSRRPNFRAGGEQRQNCNYRPPDHLAISADSAVNCLKRDGFWMNHDRASAYCLRMIFSENRFTLFRIML
jgi:hypothetical protein